VVLNVATGETRHRRSLDRGDVAFHRVDRLETDEPWRIRINRMLYLTAQHDFVIA
jgi:hypothetical protein